MKRILLLIALAALAVPAGAQPVARGPVPVQNPVDVLRADLAAQAGGTIVYFSLGSAQLSPQARASLARQALWLRQHPAVAVRIEGRGDPMDTRNHSLAMGARRAEEARTYLLLLGVPSAQLTTMSWGKERPGPPSATTTIAP